MRAMFRIVVTFVSWVAAFHFVYWVGGALISSASPPGWIQIQTYRATTLAASIETRNGFSRLCIWRRGSG